MSVRNRTKASQRRNELDRILREYAKMGEQKRARYEVERYENSIDLIRSIHLEYDDPINWNEVRNSPPPYEKGSTGPKQLAAEHNLAKYKPSLLDTLFRRAEHKRIILEQKISEAFNEDEADYRAWEENVYIADKVLKGDTKHYLRVIEKMKPLDDLREYGSGFEFFVGDSPNDIAVEFTVHSKQIVPKEVKTLTKTGKLSTKDMPKTKYYELEQDYVCSCVIRIALDLFALLPVANVILHAMDERINPATGYMEMMTILSIQIDRPTLYQLKLDTIDCSEAVRNFTHRMNFLKTKGFQPISKVDLTKLKQVDV